MAEVDKLAEQLAHLIESGGSDDLERAVTMTLGASTGEEHRLGMLAITCWGASGLALISEMTQAERSVSRIANGIVTLAKIASGEASIGSMFSTSTLAFVRNMAGVRDRENTRDSARNCLSTLAQNLEAQDFLGALGVVFSQADQTEYAMISEVVEAIQTRWPSARQPGPNS